MMMMTTMTLSRTMSVSGDPLALSDDDHDEADYNDDAHDYSTDEEDDDN